MQDNWKIRFKKLVNNQWVAGLCIALISPIIFNNAGKWLSGSSSAIATTFNNRILDVLKSSVIQNDSDYYYPLAFTLYIFVLAGTLSISVVLERTEKRFAKELGNLLVVFAFLLYFGYTLINAPAKSSFLEFRIAAICSTSTYQEFAEFQKSIYIAKSYTEAKKIIRDMKSGTQTGLSPTCGNNIVSE